MLYDVCTHSIYRKIATYHATIGDMESNLGMDHVDLDVVLLHWFVWGGEGEIVVLHETRWKYFIRISWEQEVDPTIFSGGPVQRGEGNRKYHRMRIYVAVRERHRAH